MDTDADSCGEDALDIPDKLDKAVASGVAGSFGAVEVMSEAAASDQEGEEAAPDGSLGAEDADLAPEAEPRFRHPAGTFKIAESTWFFVTKTPGWIDVKCTMKYQFRGHLEGMANGLPMSRTLTPYHYGDEWEDPWRSLLLLRSWSIWRARAQGWARAKECRNREVLRQEARLVADLRREHVSRDIALRQPLVGSAPAHTLFAKWTPEVVRQLCSAA